MRIGDIDIRERVLLVAEIGNNHEGDIGRARELVRAAAEAGVPAVKFQTFRTERFVSSADPKRVEQLRSYELSFDQFAELAELARSLGLLFLSTALDLESADFLEDVVDAYKIASGDNDFYPLIERVAASDRPLLISTGISDLAQVERSVAAVERVRGVDDSRESLALLHCVSAYPAEPEELSLRSIPFLAERFPYAIGYSDHSLGNAAALAAVALGARVIEKHFTLEGIESDFRDHAMSAKPADMRALGQAIAELEPMLGTPAKEVAPGEIAADAIRRSIAAAADLEAGHRIETSDLMWVRPGTGLRPGQESELVGRTLRVAKQLGELVVADDVD